MQDVLKESFMQFHHVNEVGVNSALLSVPPLYSARLIVLLTSKDMHPHQHIENIKEVNVNVKQKRAFVVSLLVYGKSVCELVCIKTRTRVYARTRSERAPWSKNYLILMVNLNPSKLRAVLLPHLVFQVLLTKKWNKLFLRWGTIKLKTW